MSKIQQALSRIQARQTRSGRPESVPDQKQREDDSPSLGKKAAALNPDTTIIGHLDETGQFKRPDDTDHRLVIVDRDRLRENGLISPVDQARNLADQYRRIKRPILDLVEGVRADTESEFRNLVMVASALPGDGKTFTCLNLALSIAAEKDSTVLLVDADVAKPHISALFGVDQEAGLIDLLKDSSLIPREAVLKTDLPRLQILPAGRFDEHATELLASKRMVDVVTNLANLDSGRVVVFDSPPLLVTSDAQELASVVGQIALVVRAGHTPKHAVSDCLDILDERKAISIILNQANERFGLSGYSEYGYGGAPTIKTSGGEDHA